MLSGNLMRAKMKSKVSLLFSPAAVAAAAVAAAEYLKGPKFTRTPEWAARGRGPQAKT